MSIESNHVGLIRARLRFDSGSMELFERLKKNKQPASEMVMLMRLGMVLEKILNRQNSRTDMNAKATPVSTELPASRLPNEVSQLPIVDTSHDQVSSLLELGINADFFKGPPNVGAN